MRSGAMSTSGLFRDPRHYQIGALSALLVYGTARLGFDIGAARAVLILGTALFAQLAFDRLCGRPRFEPRSALISGLSLCLLLRTGSPLLAILATVLAVGSKFTVRVHGKHVFNPTNFGIVATVLLTGAAWVSPGQWGTSAFFAFLMACVGGLVVHRALRSDVTVAFLGSYMALLFARAFWLGDPWTIPFHQLESGSLLLFAFFMISDPRTTPDARSGRLAFGVLVASLAVFLQFGLHRPGGALLALFALSPLVPLMDRWLPGPRYSWPVPAPKGVVDASLADAGPVPLPVAPGGAPVLRLLRRQGG
jgi:Na+-transporting NADH:ubiquinone oxidoreductase subunit NqrB